MKQKTIVAFGVLVVGFGLLTVTEAQGQSGSERSRGAERGSSKGPGSAKGTGNAPAAPGMRNFRRIATFPVIRNYCGAEAPQSCRSRATVAEIVAASEDGRLLVYTDSANNAVGFVDISNPRNPLPGGVLAVGGSPTSVAVAGKYALVAVDSSQSFVNPSGHLTVINLDTKTVVQGAESINLGGQPDSVAVSPDKRYALIAIENQRDEEAGDGAPPQDPGGKLMHIDLRPANNPFTAVLGGHPLLWQISTIELAGIPDKFPNDPEVEYVDINEQNIAVVTLQENNHIVLVDMNTKAVVGDFPAGAVDLALIDTEEEGVINFNSSLTGVLREPDAVKWISNDAFVTADEGDLDGGSRGFTIFSRNGTVLYASGANFEHLGGIIGHYPESRSENKGTEPEGAEFGKYGPDDYLFIGSERGSFVGVYLMMNGEPVLRQALPAGVGPEGLKAIPQRNLLVVSSEEDDNEGQTFRAAVSIYALDYANPTYPTMVSSFDEHLAPIPWAALSGLATHPQDSSLAYSVSDSYYSKGYIYATDISGVPGVIYDRVEVTGAGDLDLEGVAVRSDGSLWLASEGNANGSLKNRLLAVNPVTGAVLQTVELPDSVHARRTGNGFEGLAVTGAVGVSETVYVAFQREWQGDPARKVRIGVYDVQTATWGFLYYPIDAVTSPNGGWVGLSEITSLGGGSFAVIERDNQAGDNARIKRIYRFSVVGLSRQADCEGTCSFPTVVKTLVRDLMPDLRAAGGAVIEKVEGLAVTANGRTLIHTDNDGVEDSNGETQFIDLGFGVLP